MNGNGRPGRQDGFTVIELLITVVVITLVIGMGVPMYTEFTRGAEMSSRTSELVASLNLARSEAVSRRANVALVASGDAMTRWNAGWEVRLAADGTVLYRVQLDAAFPRVWIQEDADIATFTFDPEGRLDNSALFRICGREDEEMDDTRDGRQVDVSRFGRVQLTTLNNNCEL